jgi:hypothetical protein
MFYGAFHPTLAFLKAQQIGFPAVLLAPGVVAAVRHLVWRFGLRAQTGGMQGKLRMPPSDKTA